MARAFHPIQTDNVDAISLRGEGVPNRDALVDGNEPRLLEPLDEFLRGGAGGLDNLDLLLDDDGCVFVVRRGLSHGGKDRKIDPERLGRQGAQAANPLPPLLRRTGVVDRYNSKAARVGHSRRKFGSANPCHASHDDRVLDAEHLRNSCSNGHGAVGGK